ncbi:hypothetical protein DBV15_09015 [Temnothorax longispinosus]|uniref:Piwi domain-containing protein n=1 Tax=Temnothorax longispinosus TaxID=300112 RepID=A0A4V3SAB9_9HYME|nr:hypothetical protein DBV15_09015 [Temnothorax longispinosus]
MDSLFWDKSQCDGVLRMGYSESSLLGTRTVFENMIRQGVVSKPIISIYLNQNYENSPDGGLLILGQPNHAHYMGEFTDGVSDTEFPTIMYNEIEAMRRAAAAVTHDGGDIKITCLIVQKSNHVRLFPISDTELDKGNCNVKTGTIVDDTTNLKIIITPPDHFDFYFVSYAKSRSDETVRPTNARQLWTLKRHDNRIHCFREFFRDGKFVVDRSLNGQCSRCLLDRFSEQSSVRIQVQPRRMFYPRSTVDSQSPGGHRGNSI